MQTRYAQVLPDFEKSMTTNASGRVRRGSVRPTLSNE